MLWSTSSFECCQASLSQTKGGWLWRLRPVVPFPDSRILKEMSLPWNCSKLLFKSVHSLNIYKQFRIVLNYPSSLTPASHPFFPKGWKNFRPQVLREENAWSATRGRVAIFTLNVCLGVSDQRVSSFTTARGYLWDGKFRQDCCLPSLQRFHTPSFTPTFQSDLEDKIGTPVCQLQQHFTVHTEWVWWSILLCRYSIQWWGSQVTYTEKGTAGKATCK